MHPFSCGLPHTSNTFIPYLPCTLICTIIFTFPIIFAFFLPVKSRFRIFDRCHSDERKGQIFGYMIFFRSLSVFLLKLFILAFCFTIFIVNFIVNLFFMLQKAGGCAMITVVFFSPRQKTTVPLPRGLPPTVSFALPNE